MPKKINVATPTPVAGSRISPQAVNVTGSPNDAYARLAFSSVCDTHCPLAEWQGSELKALVDLFKRLEKMTWMAIMGDNGLGYERILHAAFPRPQSLPPDAKLHSLNVSGRSRLYGYRTENFFNIIWFDRSHAVCPMGRPQRYAM